MRKPYKLMIVAILMLLSLFTMTTAVFAEAFKIDIPPADRDNFNKAYKNMQDDSKFKLLPKAGTEGSEKEIISFEGSTVYFEKDAFKDATDKSRKDALTVVVDNLQDSGVDEQTQQNIFDQMGAINKDVSALLIPMIFDKTNADIFTAYKWLAPSLVVVRIIFGVGAIAIVFVLIASTIMDLAYIGLPMMRELGNKEGGGESKPFGVSYDAISTVKETESSLGSSGKYKNAYVTYFGRRATTYIVLAISLLYLVVGELGGLIGKLMSLGSGIVQ